MALWRPSMASWRPSMALWRPSMDIVEAKHGLVEPIHGLVESFHGLAESADLPVLAVPVPSMAGVGTENASLTPAMCRFSVRAGRLDSPRSSATQQPSTTACYRPKRSHPRRRMGSGGSRGLQNRCFGAEASKGWFDSDAPPPARSAGGVGCPRLGHPLPVGLGRASDQLGIWAAPIRVLCPSNRPCK